MGEYREFSWRWLLKEVELMEEEGKAVPMQFYEELIREKLSEREPDPLTEVFRPLREFPHYSINRCGEVLNSKGLIMSTSRNHNQRVRNQALHLKVLLSYNGVQHCRSIGALLKETFKDDYKEN